MVPTSILLCPRLRNFPLLLQAIGRWAKAHEQSSAPGPSFRSGFQPGNGKAGIRRKAQPFRGWGLGRRRLFPPRPASLGGAADQAPVPGARSPLPATRKSRESDLPAGRKQGPPRLPRSCVAAGRQGLPARLHPFLPARPAAALLRPAACPACSAPRLPRPRPSPSP